MSKKKLTILALVSVILIGCNDKNTAPSSIRLKEVAEGAIESYRLTDEELGQVDASNALGLDVLRYIISKEPNKSMVVPPSGFRYSLSMLANGADGTTLSYLRKAIGAVNNNLDELNDLNRRMMIGQRKAPVL